MNVIEPSSPCFLFIKAKIKPPIKNINTDKAINKYWLITIDLLYCNKEAIYESIKLNVKILIKEIKIDNKNFFIMSPKNIYSFCVKNIHR